MKIESGGLQQVVQRRPIRQSSRFGISAADTVPNLLDRQEGNAVESTLRQLNCTGRIHPTRIQFLAARDGRMTRRSSRQTHQSSIGKGGCIGGKRDLAETLQHASRRHQRVIVGQTVGLVAQPPCIAGQILSERHEHATMIAANQKTWLGHRPFDFGTSTGHGRRECRSPWLILHRTTGH